MKYLTRRSAIKKSIKAAAVAVSVPTFLPAAVIGSG